MGNNIKSASEALSVLVQVAELAQSKGILSLDDAALTKQSIDFFKELAAQNVDQGSPQ